MVCRADDDKDGENVCMIRLLLADSGHYTIPIDNDSQENSPKAAQADMVKVASSSTTIWDDVSPAAKKC